MNPTVGFQPSNFCNGYNLLQMDETFLVQRFQDFRLNLPFIIISEQLLPRGVPKVNCYLYLYSGKSNENQKSFSE